MLVCRSLVVRIAVGSALLAGCNDLHSGDDPPVGSVHAPIISDQLHSNGTKGFLWLPPMVGRMPPLGTFVGKLPITVRVDQIDDHGKVLRTLAAFTSKGGPKRERVREHVGHGGYHCSDDDNDDDRSFYIARWNTDDERLSMQAHYRARVFVPARAGGLREIGFSDIALFRNLWQFLTIDRDEYTPLRDGRVLHIKFRVEKAAVDGDGDGILDWNDNCPAKANADQKDTRKNGVGDACRCDNVTCAAADACHLAGVCSGATGTCSSPAAGNGTSCPIGNATGACQSGACVLSACIAGFADCNHNLADGCETLVTTTANCGGCGVTCAAGANGTAVCNQGSCGIACSSGRANCDGNAANGCEVTIASDPANCGGCGVRCELNAICDGGACVAQGCAAGTADCDGDAGNGCEVNTGTDANHCGTCGLHCSLPNGVAACVNGACAVASCAPGFADCDGAPGNGCEADLNWPTSCGSCQTQCNFPSGSGACVGGQCVLSFCDSNRSDCNGDPSDGCEVSLMSYSSDCGSCGHVCPTPPHAPALCLSGQCAVGFCDQYYADCDGVVDNGCEVFLPLDTNNCGTCGAVCPARANSTSTCFYGGVCNFVCNDGFADCDLNPANGCEVATSSSAGNCGACGLVCGNGSTCRSGACTSATCAAGFGDCNHNAADLCEANLTTSVTHCGACGIVCSFPNAAAECLGGTCGWSVCLMDYADCDTNPTNGCEVNVATDASNCGGCGVHCAGGQSCRSGVCQ